MFFFHGFINIKSQEQQQHPRSLGFSVDSYICVLVLPLNYSAQAETGKGADVFKVITTIFDVDESKGDVVAIVTAKNEVAKVKLLDALGPEVIPINASEGGEMVMETMTLVGQTMFGIIYYASIIISKNTCPSQKIW